MSGKTQKLVSLLLIIGFLAALELVARAEIVAPDHLPPSTAILSALFDRLHDPALAGDVGRTLEGWGVGLAVASLLALPLGIAVGLSPVLYRLLRGPVELIRPVPSVAFVPLVVLTLGSGLEGKVFLVAFAAFWPLLIHAIYGVRDIDPQLLETARSLGLGRLTRLGWVTVPGALPYVGTGLRTASAIALILAVTTELVIGTPGLGQSISLAQSGGAVADMYALVVVAGALGWALNGGLVWLERRLLRWQAAFQERG